MTKYVSELEHGVWIAPWSGDPGRTLVIGNAKLFNFKSTAWRSIERAQKMRPFKNAKVVKINDPTPEECYDCPHKTKPCDARQVDCPNAVNP